MAEMDYIAAGLHALAVPIASLVADPQNARKHSERNIAAIRGSLSRFGQRKPIVVQQEGMVVRAGNGTLTAALALGWTHLAAVVVSESDAEAMAFALADNRTAELAEWDGEALGKRLDDLPADVLESIGFSKADVARLGGGTDVVEDEVPEPAAEPVSRRGDLWVLGNHRLLCGDSTDAGDVALLLGGAVPFIMVTDPPYGVEYDPEWRQEAGINKNRGRMGDVPNDDRADWSEAWALFAGSVAYIWHGALHASEVAKSIVSSAMDIRGQIIWKKSRFVLSRGAYHWGHEPCWYAVRKGGTAKWCGDRSQSTVWDIALAGGGGDDLKGLGHSTQKPVECMARPIRNHGEAVDDVYDPFVGSGTTIVAAEQLGRRCFAMEITPVYVDVAVRRWQNLTGLDAVLYGDGDTWRSVAAKRGVGVDANENAPASAGAGEGCG